MNQVNIIGAPVTELEIRKITTRRSGAERSVLDTRIVVPRGGKNDPKDYFPVTFFGKDAETVAKYSGPGKRLGITGRLELQSWGPDDAKQYKVAIIAERVKIIDWPREDADSDSASDADAQEREPVGVAAGTLVDPSDFAPAPGGYPDDEISF